MSPTVSTRFPWRTVSDGVNKVPVENKCDLKPKTVRTKEAKDFNKSEAERVDVMDTLPHAISIIEKEMAKNLAFLQKEIDKRNTNSIMAAHIIRKTSRSSSVDDEAYHRADHRRFMRKHSRLRCDRPVPFKA